MFPRPCTGLEDASPPAQRPELAWVSYRGVRDVAVDLLPRTYESLADEGLEGIEEYIEQYGG